MSAPAASVFQDVLRAAGAYLEEQVGRTRYRQWFRDAEVLRLSGRRVTLGVPTEVHRTWIRAWFGPRLEEAFARVLGEGVEVDLVVSARLDARREVRDALPEDDRAWDEAVALRRPPAGFETFVPDDGHRLVLAVLEQVLHGGPSAAPRVVVLVGPPGSGKTHLLRAVVRAAQARAPGAALYLSARELTRRVVDAVRSDAPGAAAALGAALAEWRWLAVDDLDALATRPRTQQELGVLLDQAGGPEHVVVAGRRPPREVDGLSDRLASLLLSGVVLPVPAPTGATVEQALGVRARAAGVALAPATAAAILARARAPREAFALLDRWCVASERLGRPLAPEFLDEIAPPTGPSTPRDEVVRRAKTVVADYFGLPRRTLDRATKRPVERFPRQVAMYLVWRAASLSLQEVARSFGLKSHAAASRALQEVRARRDADPDVESLLDGLLARL